MPNYRRLYKPGTTWFFTVNLANRKDNPLLVQHINTLGDALRYVRKNHPFTLDAFVVLPDHLHCIWTLPSDQTDYSTRWRLLKSYFSRHIPMGVPVSPSRKKRGERGIWQRRFWAHVIGSQADFNNHVDYIHWNPVKHGYVNRALDWPYSSFGRFVSRGVLPPDWGHNGTFTLNGGE